jgi:hypothetical protein
MPLQVPSNCISSTQGLNPSYIVANSQAHQLFNTLQHPRRVRVLPPHAMRSSDDINAHQHTDV